VSTAEESPIPVEVRARIEANAFFTALQVGDYEGVARAHTRLLELGWYIRPVIAKPERKRRVPKRSLSLAEARERDVCRICERSIGVLNPGSVTYNFGDEFAHTACLDGAAKAQASP
jgi:hypothetical protein